MELSDGFRFNPFEHELFNLYLKPKVLGEKLPRNVVEEKQLYDSDANPWKILDPETHSWILSEVFSGKIETVTYVFVNLTKKEGVLEGVTTDGSSKEGVLEGVTAVGCWKEGVLKGVTTDGCSKEGVLENSGEVEIDDEWMNSILLDISDFDYTIDDFTTNLGKRKLQDEIPNVMSKRLCY
ncbi:hypothetical protein POM88_010172 [Heracleum sosnowskyi]|uniref:NAC domain-containing protein n=1 Tax=Heracleum sosnowskyi TaxID=360622 RepID=A0AAD8N877_9APIA|nr:hypothetical protein POM88_010172 [Heracleum sosnowskyi]